MTAICIVIVFGVLHFFLKDHKKWFESNKIRIGILLVLCSIADLVIIYQLIQRI